MIEVVKMQYLDQKDHENGEDQDSETDLEVLFKPRYDEDNGDFYFQEYKLISSKEVAFIFRHGDVEIQSLMQIPNDEDLQLTHPLSQTLHYLIVNIGMCVLSWFYMGFATSKIIIGHKVSLPIRFIPFWKEFYKNVFAEFKYVHNLHDLDIDIEVETSEYNIEEQNSSIPMIRNKIDDSNSRRVLLPIGGGKDSIVVWHKLLQQSKEPILMYISDTYEEFDQNIRLQEVVNIMQSNSNSLPLLVMKHSFHSSNFEKYARSFYKPCGHPFAALVVFDCLFLAYLLNITEISFGFEKSADDGNGIRLSCGTEVNHQYDKSSQFIKLVSEFSINELSLPLIQLKSEIQQLDELEICQVFVSNPLKKFHHCFLSCNMNSDLLGRSIINPRGWCCQCEKCAFVFLLLSAYLNPCDVQVIFGGCDLLSNKSSFIMKMKPIFYSLVGLFDGLTSNLQHKPFECVGTVHETRKALALAFKRRVDNNFIIEDMLQELVDALQLHLSLSINELMT